MLFSVLVIAFIAIGFLGRQIMLNKNACQMTFTSHAKAWIEVKSSLPGVGELYRHPAQGKLNPQPVLFIHGQMGKADQVRSLSSPMHNDDEFFQYFAVEFKDKIGSAVHGASLLTQATFVNDAIRTILEMYDSDAESKRPKSKKGVKVMLVGHSMGGMVARTAVLLSNHPVTNALGNNTDKNTPLTAACAVSDIIMLSTPNKAPPYSADASLAAVYQAINKGWYMSHYHTSRDCVEAREQLKVALSSSKAAAASGKTRKDSATNEDHVCSLTNNTRNYQQVHLRTECSVCAPQIRLLSVTGGDIDLQVPAHLAGLQTLTPRANNLTSSADIGKPKVQGTGSEVSEGGLISGLISRLGFHWTAGLFRSAVHSLNPFTIFSVLPYVASTVKDWAFHKIGWANAETLASVPNVASVPVGEGAPEVVAPGLSQDTIATSAESLPRPNYSNYTYGNLMKIDQRHWDAHMAPYIDSQHYSVRSQQLRDCGFVVDHLAIVWCRQLIHAVSDAMRILARNPSDLADPRIGTGSQASISYTDNLGRMQWEKVLPGRNTSSAGQHYARATSDASLMIPPVASFFLKNASFHAFANLGAVEDLRYVGSKMNWGLLEGLAIWYVSNHLGSILTAYVFISIMIVCIPLRRRLTNWSGANKTEHALSDFASLRIMAHLHLEDIIPCLFVIVTPILNAFLPPAVLTSDTYTSLLSACRGLNAEARSERPVYEENFITKLVKGTIPLAVCIAAIFAKVYVEYRKSGDWAHVLHSHKGVVAIVVSYYAAVVFRFFLCSSIYGIRFIVGGVLGFIRNTLYKKVVPKAVRKFVSNRFFAVLPPVSAYLPITALSVGSLLIYLTNSRCKELGVLGRVEYFVSVSTVSLFCASVPALLLALLAPWPGSAEYEHLQTSFALLYLPMLILGAPSAIYSVRLLFEDGDMFANAHSTFAVFGDERLNYLVIVVGIFFHWLIMTIWKEKYAYVGDVSEISSLVHLLGRPSARSDTSFTWDSAIPINSGDVQCCHEDGGRFATFEEISCPVLALEGENTRASDKMATKSMNNAAGSNAGNKSVEVSKGVVLGSTYRVVHCECFRDAKLKDTSEWCEFCLCSRCGFKNLPKDYFSNKNAHTHADPSGLQERYASSNAGQSEYGISATVILLVGVLGFCARGMYFYSDQPHEQFNVIGGIAWCFLARDYLVYKKVLNP